MKKQTLSILAFLILTSCGFQPMYGTAFQSEQSAEIQNALEQVEIVNIPDWEGQYLRNALIDRFYRDHRPINPEYVLTVNKIEERLIDLDITKNSDATRGQLQLKTAITLRDKKTGEVLLERNLRSITSYNILTSEFATRVTEQNTRRNALDDLASQIELQIGLYLKRDQ